MLGGDLDQAREAVQQTFLKLCQQDTVAIQNRVLPWLFTVCRNSILDQRKRHSSSEVTGGPSAERAASREPNPAEIASRQEFVALIRQLMQSLPDAQREALDLWASGVGYREIGEVISKTESASHVLVHRAIQNIKQHPSVASWLESEERISFNGNSAAHSAQNPYI
jgi:RNA polymerase sigma-70 factor (ECF subfamily)